MALTVNEINSVSIPNQDKVIEKQAYDKSPVLAKLKQLDKISQGGTEMRWSLRYKQTGTAAPVDPDARVEYQTIPTRTTCIETMGHFLNTAWITQSERETNSGKCKIIDLKTDKLEEMLDDMNEMLAKEIYQTTRQAHSTETLCTIISASGEIHGINTSDIAHWAGHVDSSTTRLDLSGSTTSLKGMRNAASWEQNAPNFYVTTPALWDTMEIRLEGKQLYTKKEKSVDYGWDELMFYGDPVVKDRYCPAGYFFGLFLDGWEFRVNPDYNFKVKDWSACDQMGYEEALKSCILLTAALINKDRYTNFKYTALDADL
jgi:hypothetical protein